MTYWPSEKLNNWELDQELLDHNPETFTHRRHLPIASIRCDAGFIRYLINVAYGYLSRENWDLIKAMGKCRLWVNVAMGICRMGICRMGICRLTVRKQVLTTCRVLNELTVREGGGVVLLPRSPSGARRRPCPLGQLPWCRWNGSALLVTFTFTKSLKFHYLNYIWPKSLPGSHPRHQKLLLGLGGSQYHPRHLRWGRH